MTMQDWFGLRGYKHRSSKHTCVPKYVTTSNTTQKYINKSGRASPKPGQPMSHPSLVPHKIKSSTILITWQVRLATALRFGNLLPPKRSGSPYAPRCCRPDLTLPAASSVAGGFGIFQK
jgi:hypothetical protein